jgi:hypothetical protein
MATWKQVQMAMMHLDGLQQIRDEVLIAETVDQETMADRMALQKSVINDPDVVAGMAVWAGLGVEEALDYAKQCDVLLAVSTESAVQRAASVVTP